MKLSKLLPFGVSLFACVAGRGDDEPVDCNPPVERWCEEQNCEGVRTLDEALAWNADGGLAGFSLSVCDDRRVVHSGNHFVGALYSYDAETAALVGVDPYSDFVVENATCGGNRRAGEEIPRRCERSCELIGAPPEFNLDFAPCAGSIGEPFLMHCLSDPPVFVEDCAACACPACYPQLVANCPQLEETSNVDVQSALCGAIAWACIDEHCHDECARVNEQ